MMFVEILHKEKKLNTFELNINKCLHNSYNLICIFFFVFISDTFGNTVKSIINSEVLSLCFLFSIYERLIYYLVFHF